MKIYRVYVYPKPWVTEVQDYAKKKQAKEFYDYLQSKGTMSAWAELETTKMI
jgi:hypothetical protein